MTAPKQRIDVHAHYLSPTYAAALQANDLLMIGGLPTPRWSPELALEFMDAHEIAVQILSASDPGVEFLDPAAAADLARECNDYVAGVVSDHPDRFGAFAVLSMGTVDSACTEAVRGLDDLGLDGVGLLSSYGGRYLGDPALSPLLDILDARGAWVMVHPATIATELRPQLPIPGFVAEYPFDTTRAFLSLLFNGVFESYPRIRWQFAHGGGTVPMLRPRMAAVAAGAKQFGPMIGLPAGAAALQASSAHDALKRSFYDTALIADHPALRAVADVTLPGHVLFGSDWPFAARMYPPSGDPQPALSEAFPGDERLSVDRLGAIAQFPRFSPPSS